MAIVIDKGGFSRGFTQSILGGGSQTYVWDGYSYFPTYGYQGFDDTLSITDINLYQPKTTWDLTNYRLGQECLFFLSLLHNNGSTEETFQITYSWYDPDDNFLFLETLEYTLPAGYKSYFWYGVGVAIDNGTSRYNEVYKNGNYEIRLTGDVTATYTATVQNLDESKINYVSSTYKGYIWVEGDNICFISGDYYKIKINHDGTIYETGLENNAGEIWIPSSGDYLCYIDSSGNLRHTHVGDKYGTSSGWDSTVTTDNVGTINKGYMWVRDNWSFIYFINNDGYVVRLGPGYVYGDGP